MLKLKKAKKDDYETIHRMQVQSFQDLYTKYKDRNTSPAVEPIEKIVEKLSQDFSDFYMIEVDNKVIGAIRVVKVIGNKCRISPIFILPEFQGKGYAQQAIKSVESLYPKATNWMLETIKEEAKLCHLYEKMGYRATEKEEVIQDKMTIAYYIK